MAIYSNASIALFHGVSWCAKGARQEIAPGLKLCRMEGSNVREIYENLCTSQNIDDGEPFAYEVYASLKPDSINLHLAYGHPYSLAERLANMIAISTGIPPRMCRVFSPAIESEYQKITTQELYWLGDQNEFLCTDNAELDDDSVKCISILNKAFEQMWNENKSYSRLIAAQSYFYNAWRAKHIEQICLNLAIAAEMLFSPDGRTEITHQLAFNMAKFVEPEPELRLKLYRKIKKFYGFRSAVVHGGLPDDGKLIEPSVEMFQIVACVLRRILSNDSLIERFNNDQCRKAYLTSLIFDTQNAV